MKKIHPDYFYLPEQFWKKHELCVYLIGQVEEFILKEEYIGLKVFSLNLENEKDTPNRNEHIFDFLIRTKRKDYYEKLVTCQVLHGLIIDMCYFIQEALTCSKKQRTVVTFALLRKPFVYDLIVVLRLMFEDGFIEKFNEEDDFDSTGLNKDEKIVLLEEATKYTLTKPITEIEMYEFIFDTKNPNSIINLSNKALHPSTTRNQNNKTGKQNLNFAFSENEDIQRYWQYIYSVLPMVLTYLVEIIEIFVFSLLEIDSKIYSARIEDRAQKLIELTGVKIE
ncbi:hypothetical protein OU798_15980 [Prolixibacteraceae bacterium Z1-6]|uniref:Uncharacterized protein n=1 Tax=Draconibacterium aestuarii TaxID=2998507 RepID=A0A9X3F792_9BACT|nr:hypothetical protein [Prolixibacteraceae bacterium Z1-6]